MALIITRGFGNPQLIITRGFGGPAVFIGFRTATAELCVTTELDSNLCK